MQHFCFTFSDIITLFELYYDGKNYENESYYESCEEGGEHAQCHPGEQKCYSRSAICQYDTEAVDQDINYIIQAGCRDGSHLRTDCGKV